MSSVRWTERDRFGHIVHMTNERWEHISRRHDDVIDKEHEIRECLRAPNVVYRHEAEGNEVLEFFLRRATRQPQFVVVVVVKTKRPFIVTAHLDNDIKPRRGSRLIWIRF